MNPSPTAPILPHVQRLGLALAVLVPIVALLPLGRLAWDWFQVSRVLPQGTMPGSERGYDWVQWEESNGRIVARYVFPRSPAREAGLHAGDIFVMIEGQMIFGADELKRVVAGLPPGTVVRYEVTRADEARTIDVPLTRYPTFLYPLTAELWFFTLWGFLSGALLHVMGLAIAIPLARSSLRARYSLGLLLVSSLWMFSNLARLLFIEFFGPAGMPGSRYDVVFQALTVLGLVGWLLFPALLVTNVINVSGGQRLRAFRRTRAVRYAPPVLLGGLTVLTVWRGSVGPLSLDVLAGPMLFYATCYIAGAAALSLVLGDARSRREATRAGWNRWGSLLTLLAATVVGLALLGLFPLLAQVQDATLGWLVVLTQLLSVAPITLVTLSTLRYGKVGAVLSSAFVNGLVAVSAFVLFAGTMYALNPILERTEAPVSLIGAALCVLILFGAEGLRHWLTSASFFLSGDQQRMQKALRDYAQRLNELVDTEALAAATVAAAGEGVRASSAVLYHRLPGESEWRSAAYHPAPPHLTAQAVARLWPRFRDDQQLWARDDELSDARLSPADERELRRIGAALVVPIRGDGAAVGLLALAERRGGRRVYNLDDIGFLRILCGQFGLAVERLALLEREVRLVKAHTEARLVALRAQINPHFLFNALNTIASLVAERPDEAERVVEHLSAIFRHTLQTAEAAFVPLGEEMDLVSHYLAIEKARFGDALTTTVDVPDHLRSVPVPPFTVQTLVENSVKHGLGPRRGGGAVGVTAHEMEGHVVVEVADDGVGIAIEPDSPTAFYGIGLENVAARLNHLYGDNRRFTLESRPGGGTRATLRIPLSQPTETFRP